MRTLLAEALTLVVIGKSLTDELHLIPVVPLWDRLLTVLSDVLLRIQHIKLFVLLYLLEASLSEPRVLFELRHGLWRTLGTNS